MTDQPTEPGTSPRSRKIQAAWEHIQEALQGLRFGEVTIIVQDGVVVQVDRTERKRLDRVGKR